MSDAKYSFHVYEDRVIIIGSISMDVLIFIMELCKKEGFTHMKPLPGNKQGFILVKKEEIK